MHVKAEIVKHIVFLIAYTTLLVAWVTDIVLNNTIVPILDIPGILITGFGAVSHIIALKE